MAANPNPIRIGVVAPCWIDGGAEIHTRAVLDSLDPDRFAIQGIAIKGGPFNPDAADCCPWIVSDAPEAIPHLLRQSDLILSWKFCNLKAPLEGTTHRPRVAYVNHTVEPWTEAQAKTVRRVDRVVSVSELAMREVPASFAGRSSVIWNAVDPARLEARRDRAEMRRLWGIPEGVKVAGYLGRLAPEKDPLAMARLARELPPDWVAVVVGEGPLKGHLGGISNLIVAGRDPGAGDVLGAFEALIVPSRYESFGLTLAEGICKGLPVVSTRSGLASLRPGIVEEIPVEADGATIARALARAVEAGPTDEARLLIPHLGMERFRREWAELLTSLAPRPVAEILAAHRKVKACEQRVPPKCGCPSAPGHCRRDDRTVHLDECLTCVEA